MKTWNDRLAIAIKESPFSQTDLARIVKVSNPTVSDWVKGKTKEMKRENVSPVCRTLDITEKWLFEGKGPMRPGGQDSVREVHGNYSAADIRGWVPLISYVQAGQWSEAMDIYEPGYGEKLSPTTVPHSKSTFALRVEGRSMTRPEGAHGPSFPHGMIIYVDPERDCAPGDYVIARFNDNHATFKQLSLEEGRPVLVPLNPDSKQYPVIRDEFEIIGRVIDGAWGGI